MLPLLRLLLMCCVMCHLVSTRQAPDLKSVRECTSNKILDLAFILDASGSIGDSSFDNAKSFLSDMIRKLDIGPDRIRIGLVVYSGMARVVFHFDSFTQKDRLIQALQRLKYETGTTRTGNAIMMAQTEIFPRARGDPVPKVAVVITDGRSQDLVDMPAQMLRDDNVTIYAVGVSDDVNVDELLLMTGSPLRIFTVARYADLDDRLIKVVTGEVCKSLRRKGTTKMRIVCESNSIGIHASIKQAFEGNVFIKGHYHTDDCRVGPEGLQAEGDESENVGIVVSFNKCGVRRTRSLNPRGVYVETVAIFSYHPLFITKVDQAIRIQCFYMEADKTVGLPLEVSMITPEEKFRAAQMPVCSYSLRSNHPNGPVVRFARVGDIVYHRWHCADPTSPNIIYGMLVHSCRVDDGRADRVFVLIDDKGCATDASLIGTPDYAGNLSIAYRETMVFKLADKSALQFQCQISLCIKKGGGCESMTPPECNQSRRKRWLTDKEDDFTLDVLSQSMEVLEVAEQSRSKVSILDDKKPKGFICVAWSRWDMTVLVVILLLLGLTLASVVYIFMCSRQPKTFSFECGSS